MQVTRKLDGESDYQIDSPSARIKWFLFLQNLTDAPCDHLGLKG